MPGLLDDYGSLLRGKPKIMPGAGMLDPTGPVAMTAGEELDPFRSGMRAEALELRGAAPAPVPGGTLAGPNQQRAFAAGDQPGAGFGPRPPPGLAVAQADAAPPKTNLAEMNFGLGDNFPGPKLGARLAEGLPMTGPAPSPPPSLIAGPVAPAAPGPAGGGGLPATAPLPPIRPPTQVADGPRWRTDPPLPPPRPPGTQLAGSPAPAMPPPRPAGLTAGGNPMPPPNPIIPPNIGAPPPSIASAAAGPITPAPIAPPVTAPIAPPIAPAASAGAGAAAGAGAGAAGGGLGALGGIMSGIAGIAKGISGNKGPPPPEAKAPQITPMGQDTMKAGIAQGSQQAMQGILASPSLIDPRKRMQGLA